MAEESPDDHTGKKLKSDKYDIPDIKYEYLDHTADVQYVTSVSVLILYGKKLCCKEGVISRSIRDIVEKLHAWGDDLKEAFEQVVIAMFGYMTTDYSTVEMLEEQELEAEGDDLESLLYHFLDEWLFLFSAEPFFIARKVVITEFDLENFKIKSKGYGEEFNIDKHPQGTEVKAITYSNMQVYNEKDKHEVFVIIDI